MKPEDPSSSAAKHGDVSPIAGSLSNLADGPIGETKKARKGEPGFEKLRNFSRVTPAQMAHVVFPPDGRYQPVRSVSSYVAPRNGKAGKSSYGPTISSEKFAGGGGILILVDQRPEDDAEYIEFTTNIPPFVYEGPTGISESERRLHIALDENAPEATPPEPFEVSLI